MFNVSFQLLLKEEKMLLDKSISRVYESFVVKDPFIKVGSAILTTKHENNMYGTEWSIKLNDNEGDYVYTFNTKTVVDIIRLNEGYCNANLFFINMKGEKIEDLDFVKDKLLNVFFKCDSDKIISVNINNIENNNGISHNINNIEKNNGISNNTSTYITVSSEAEEQKLLKNKFDFTILEERILYDIMKRIEDVD